MHVQQMSVLSLRYIWRYTGLCYYIIAHDWPMDKVNNNLICHPPTYTSKYTTVLQLRSRCTLCGRICLLVHQFISKELFCTAAFVTLFTTLTRVSSAFLLACDRTYCPYLIFDHTHFHRDINLKLPKIYVYSNDSTATCDLCM